MKDPLLAYASPWLAKQVQPLADALALPTLPLHVHELLGATLLYTFVFCVVSPWLSNRLAPRAYNALPPRRRVNWDAHVVSMFQCLLIIALSVWVLVVDDERPAMGWPQRVWAYHEGCALVQALAAGYFLWDLVVTSCYLDVFGLGTLAHAVAALTVYGLGYRPVLNYYATTFILWELSTPFLNIHWFMDKLDMTGSTLQLVNGLCLLASFFSARLVYGTWSSLRVQRDLWHAYTTPLALPTAAAGSDPGMRFVAEGTVLPTWLFAMHILSNLTLNYLNFTWFGKMIKALRKRFEAPREGGAAPPEKELVTEAEVDVASLDVASLTSATAKPATPRRRKA